MLRLPIEGAARMTTVEELKATIEALNDEVKSRERDLDEALADNEIYIAEINKLRGALLDIRESVDLGLLEEEIETLEGEPA